MKGQVGEQKSLRIDDPDGHSIEFKAFMKASNLFKKG